MPFTVKSIRNAEERKTVESARDAIKAVRDMQMRVKGAIKVEIRDENGNPRPVRTADGALR
ncbi:MAG: hypothetical protein PW791_06450 [Neorhizobium sp.]|jgi:hypothetical protein|nr:hypothetical protein [Neorhizobium sp.]